MSVCHITICIVLFVIDYIKTGGIYFLYVHKCKLDIDKTRYVTPHKHLTNLYSYMTKCKINIYFS